MLRADSVHLSYGNTLILRGAALHVAPTEVVGLVGRNGTGKSSLLRILLGAQRPDHAYLEFDGKCIKRAYRTAGLINYLVQSPFHPAGKEVRWLLRSYDIEPAGFVERHGAFGDLLRTSFDRLNHGHRRLLEVLMVLEAPTRYTLLDEPFAGLSPLTMAYVAGVITDCARRKGILLTDQHYREVLKLASRKYVLLNGHLHPFSTEAELMDLGYLPPTRLPPFAAEG